MPEIGQVLLGGVGVINLLFALFIWRKTEHTSQNIAFVSLLLSLTLWPWFLLYSSVSENINLALLSARILYIVAAAISYLFLDFVLLFLEPSRGESAEEKKKQNSRSILLFFPFAGLALLSIFSPGIIESINLRPGQNQFNFGPQYLLFVLFITIYFLTGIFIELKRYFSFSANSIERIQLRFIFLGSAIPITSSLFTNVLLPSNGIFQYQWLGPTSTIITTVLFTYAILKHNLFNAKVVAAEILTFSIWSFLFIRFLLSDSTQDRVINGALLALVVFFGILLIKSVLQEVKSREKIQQLSEGLKLANEELKRFDQAKSEFISIAGHQLRAPLTVIKGYTSLIQEGTISAVSEKGAEALNRIRISTEQLVKLVSDLLNLSRIESGKIKYEFKLGDFTKLAEGIVEEFRVNAEKKEIKLAFVNEAKNVPEMTFDPDKLREVVVNLIDNAIKYSPKGGEVIVTERQSPSLSGGRTQLRIKDSGLGIKQEDIPRLFIKFVRTEEAQRNDPGGMGIGLYFVKRVVEDHKGKVGVESEGIGKGSTFWFEIPFNAGKVQT